MTYNVFSGTLNPTQSIQSMTLSNFFCALDFSNLCIFFIRLSSIILQNISDTSVLTHST